MASRLTLEFDEEAVAKLQSLMKEFGEREPQVLISRALGLLDTITPFMVDGKLTVFDPRARSDDDQFVGVVFENVAKKAA
jgi:hypothetical protein